MKLHENVSDVDHGRTDDEALRTRQTEERKG